VIRAGSVGCFEQGGVMGRRKLVVVAEDRDPFALRPVEAVVEGFETV